MENPTASYAACGGAAVLLLPGNFSSKLVGYGPAHPIVLLQLLSKRTQKGLPYSVARDR